MYTNFTTYIIYLQKEQFAERVISFFGEAVINIVNDYLMNKGRSSVSHFESAWLQAV